jgi:hypothetical protein
VDAGREGERWLAFALLLGGGSVEVQVSRFKCHGSSA